MRLYHNPRCSKSRQALALLNEREVDFEEYRYLDHGIAEEDMNLLISLKGIIRIKEVDKSTELDLSNPQASVNYWRLIPKPWNDRF